MKGGINLHDTVKNIFMTLVADELLTNYSWKGARNKHAFGQFKIVALILGKNLNYNLI